MAAAQNFVALCIFSQLHETVGYHNNSCTVPVMNELNASQKLHKANSKNFHKGKREFHIMVSRYKNPGSERIIKYMVLRILCSHFCKES